MQHVVGDRLRLGRRAQQIAQSGDVGHGLVERARHQFEHRDALLPQLVERIVSIRERQHQIRLEGDDRLDGRRRVRLEARAVHGLRLGAEVREPVDGDQPITGAERKHDLGEPGIEADDARRRRREGSGRRHRR